MVSKCCAVGFNLNSCSAEKKPGFKFPKIDHISPFHVTVQVVQEPEPRRPYAHPPPTPRPHRDPPTLDFFETWYSVD